MRLVDKPQRLPGHCLICRSGNRSQYVDTQVALDFEGHVAICTVCVVDMANLIGHVPQLNLPHWLEGQLNEAITGVENLRGEFLDRLANYERHVSGIASSVTGMVEQSKLYIERQIAELAAEGELRDPEADAQAGDGTSDAAHGAAGEPSSGTSSEGLESAFPYSAASPKLPRPKARA